MRAMMRLDLFLTKSRKDFPRSFYQKLIRLRGVKISGHVVTKPHIPIADSGIVEIDESKIAELLESKKINPQAAPVIFEDNDFFVFNKPSGVRSESFFKELFPVHRLDKDTSGVLLVAKNQIAQGVLQKLWQDRRVKKEYSALVYGILTPPRGAIEASISRSTKNRTRMAVSTLPRSRESYTEYQVKAYYKDLRSGEKFSLLQVFPRTGRTHQIRVHFASINHPVVADKVYGKKEVNCEVARISGLTRQFLHAAALHFRHPKTGKTMKFTIPLPADLLRLLALLEKIKP